MVRSEWLRRDRRVRRVAEPLAGLHVALLFEKPSLRTKMSFEVGIAALGGRVTYLGPSEVGIGTRESAADVGRNLSRWVDAIVVRTFAHAALEELADASGVPVINALTDREHPCQALADLLTLRQHLGSLRGRRLAFVGDGNNVVHSLLLAGALAGLEVRVATPQRYAPDPQIVGRAREIAAGTGGAVAIGTDPAEAVTGADAVYTDVWTSMGAEAEAAERMAAFGPSRSTPSSWPTRPAPWSCTASPPIAGRRSPTRSWTDPDRWCSTRPRTASTPSRPCSWSCWQPADPGARVDPGSGTRQAGLSWRDPQPDGPAR